MIEQFLNEDNRDDWKRRWGSFMSGDKSEHVMMSKTFGVSEDVLTKWNPVMQTDDAGDGDANVVKLYGPIVGDFIARYFEGEGLISGSIFEDRLEAAAEDNDEVIVRINSPGGSVIEGALMFDAIAQARKRGTTVNAHVAGMSASVRVRSDDGCRTDFEFSDRRSVRSQPAGPRIRKRGHS